MSRQLIVESQDGFTQKQNSVYQSEQVFKLFQPQIGILLTRTGRATCCTRGLRQRVSCVPRLAFLVFLLSAGKLSSFFAGNAVWFWLGQICSSGSCSVVPLVAHRGIQKLDNHE